MSHEAEIYAFGAVLGLFAGFFLGLGAGYIRGYKNGVHDAIRRLKGMSWKEAVG